MFLKRKIYHFEVLAMQRCSGSTCEQVIELRPKYSYLLSNLKIVLVLQPINVLNHMGIGQI